MDLAIFGAQGTALGVYKAVRSSCPWRAVRCFLVSEMGGNAPTLAGVPVLEVGAFASGLPQGEKDNIEVLIATPEDVMQEIEACLDQWGLCCHVRVDAPRWADLMGHYYHRSGGFLPLSSLPVGWHKADVQVYMAKSHKDKPLRGDYGLPDWIRPIQVGTVLCGERVADTLDCDGEGISEKNANYSELTGLYWVWKNRLCQSRDGRHCYYGLAHYRRVLELSGDDMLRLVDNNVDVVLPYPMPYEPDIGAHHRRYLKEGDWEALLAALKALRPEYAGAFPRILEQQYLYNYNMMLAHSQVLDDYCGWLFPVLERVERSSVPKGSERADRYIGYMGETLATLYFMYNRERLNIAHVGCRLMV